MVLIYLRNDMLKIVELVRHIQLFRYKHHEFAWTLLNTMNNVHHYQTLSNNMPLDNAFLYFSGNSLDEIYISIYDWAMAEELKESLYIHENEVAKSRIMENRWWVSPFLKSSENAQF
jgi:hypothetical protein